MLRIGSSVGIGASVPLRARTRIARLRYSGSLIEQPQGARLEGSRALARNDRTDWCRWPGVAPLHVARQRSGSWVRE